MITKWRIFKLTKSRSDENAAGQGYREPLDHPEIARMTLRELADLPVPRGLCEGSK